MADDLLDVEDEISMGSGDSAVPEDFKMPSQDELLAAIEKMTGLDEKTKEELRDGILGRHKMGHVADQFGSPAAETAKNTSLEVIMLLSLISLVFLVLVFFGYKLYKSLVERERRREEKRRQKQQKKKK